jgi:hypothetical protein
VALPRLPPLVARDPSRDRPAGGADRACPREAARQVGQEGQAVAAGRPPAFGVGWETIMRAVRDEARRRFAAQGIYTRQTQPCLAIGVDEKVMNRAGYRVVAATSP